MIKPISTLKEVKALVNSRKESSTKILLTPEIAEYLIGKNIRNRPKNQMLIQQYANDIKNGKWKYTQQTIQISKSGVVLDGQHRLMAVVLTQISIEVLLGCGMDDDIFTVLDTGRVRQTSDTMAIAGIENPTKIAAMVKFIINFEKGVYDQATRGYSRGSKKVTNEFATEFALQHLDSLYQSYYYGYNKDNKIISGTTLAALHYIFKKFNNEQANIFCKSLADGLNLTRENPIYLLRKRLIEDGRTKKMSVYEKTALVVKAWNLFRNGKKISRLVIDFEKENFPKPI